MADDARQLRMEPCDCTVLPSLLLLHPEDFDFCGLAPSHLCRLYWTWLAAVEAKVLGLESHEDGSAGCLPAFVFVNLSS